MPAWTCCVSAPHSKQGINKVKSETAEDWTHTSELLELQLFVQTLIRLELG